MKKIIHLCGIASIALAGALAAQPALAQYASAQTSGGNAAAAQQMGNDDDMAAQTSDSGGVHACYSWGCY